MAHNLFNERFYSLRQAAWHGLGTIGQEGESAVDIFQRMSPYIVSLEPVYTEIGGDQLELPYRVITRHPVPDDPNYHTFGVVGPDYTLVDPTRTCEIWDESTSAYPETLGVLGKGESMFITTKLPAFEIQGDEVQSYLLLHNPYGEGAVQVRITPVRVVCQNTLIAAKAASTESFKIVHDKNVEKRLTAWMSGIMQRAALRSKGLQESFDLMAHVRLEEEQAYAVLQSIYVDPKEPRYVPDKSIMQARQKVYEAAVYRHALWRNEVLEDWKGQGVGMDSKATEGTAWGLYNAVVEVEDYRPTKQREGQRSPAAYNALFGDRAMRKESAYAEILQYAKENYT